MNLSRDSVHWINVGLMLLALGVAMVAPFHLFLLAYAVLGPLHYLTEISWLHDRQYFMPPATRRHRWLLLVGATTALMAFTYVSSELLGHPISPAVEIGLFYLVFFGAAVVLFVRHPVNAVALLLLVAGAALLFSERPGYGIAAYLLVTLVHVLLFTGVFMLYGASKEGSTAGYLSVVVFGGCALVALFLPAPLVAPAPHIRSLYGGFAQLNRVLLQLSASSTDPYTTEARGVMRLIAFAYAYHYLNWFSKTSVIRWHEVGRTRAIAILAGWAAALSLYAIDFRAGFAASYVLSVAHVMLEFPLNHRSIEGVLRWIAPLRAWNERRA